MYISVQFATGKLLNLHLFASWVPIIVLTGFTSDQGLGIKCSYQDLQVKGHNNNLSCPSSCMFDVVPLSIVPSKAIQFFIHKLVNVLVQVTVKNFGFGADP